MQSRTQQQINDNIPHFFGINGQEYQDFLQSFFDLQQNDIVIPTAQGDIPIHFSQKTIT